MLKMKLPRSMKFSSLIGKLDPGSNLNCVCSYGFKLSTSVGVLSAIGLVLAIKFKHIIDFSSSHQSFHSPRPWVVPGLENHGNNCFLNVVLQALASCSNFRKYLREMKEEFGSFSVEEIDESMPLVNSLSSLVEELCTIRHKRTVLNPQKLMLAMHHYIPSFKLTWQQDAEEAFSHLLSLLREEIAENLSSNKSYLADFPVLHNGRILAPSSNNDESEWQRWRRIFLNPFDGILGSILICKGCSLQIRQDFEFFHSLHLLPPMNSDGTIIARCTLENCLKQFFAAEDVENYCCNQCWHIDAVGYLSAFSKDKMDVKNVQRCNKSDSCECKTLSSLEEFPWSNRFSRVCKQVSMAQFPKILCIHIQRASYNILGQSGKLLDHISFPLILDLSSFMKTRVGIENKQANVHGLTSHLSSREIPFPSFMHEKLQFAPRKLNFKPSVAESTFSGTDVLEQQERNGTTVDGHCSNASLVDAVSPPVPVKQQMYRLVSVVEHFGTGQSGHYTIYRKVMARIDDEDPIALLGSVVEQWFCISDSEVLSVSEIDVLNANASLLFYEKINSC